MSPDSVRNLPLGVQIAGGAAVLLFIDMLLDWYGASASFGGFKVSASVSAWKAYSYTDILLFLLILATIGWVAATVMDHPLAGQIKLGVLGLGGLMALIVLYRIVNQPGPNKVVDVKFGAYVGFLLCLGITYGAFSSSD